jgi:outer membrane protein assembly factor BamB
VDPLGGIVGRVPLPDVPAGGLLGWNGSVLATLESGEVVSWRAPGGLRHLGRFPGRPQGGAVLVGERTLVAVTGVDAVVSLDLRTGTQKLLLGGPGSTRQFEGPPAISLGGSLIVTTVIGELLAIDAQGTVLRRLALDNAVVLDSADAGAPLASFFGRLDLTPSPPVLVDPDERVGFVRAAGRLGVVALGPGAGPVQLGAARFCGRALGLASAGPGRMLVACRGGTIGMFGDKAP